MHHTLGFVAPVVLSFFTEGAARASIFDGFLPAKVFVNGNSLYEMCTSTDPLVLRACSAYIVAVSDGLEIESERLKLNKKKPRICFPQGLVIQQEIDIVRSYMQDKPAIRSGAAYLMVENALLGAFACDK